MTEKEDEPTSPTVNTTEKRNSGVAHIFNRMDPGGAELRTAELVSEIDATFHFYGIGGGSGQLDEDLIRQGHTVINEQLRLKSILSYYRFFRSARYIAIHSHLGSASGVIMLLALLAGVPRRIVHFRSDGIGGSRRLFKVAYLWLSRIIIRLVATDILGVSPGSLQNGWKATWRLDPRCKVIPNGYDSQKMRNQTSLALPITPNEHAPLRIINVGRRLPEKNRLRSIEIWRELARSCDATLILVGDLSENEERLCAELRREFKTRSTIEIVGFTSSPLHHICSADVLLVTSTREGLPGVVLEALALGVPVVANDLPGTRWIQQQVDGIQICSVSEPNQSWIRAIHSATSKNRDAIRSSFDESSFQLKSVVPQFMEVWGLDG